MSSGGGTMASGGGSEEHAHMLAVLTALEAQLRERQGELATKNDRIQSLEDDLHLARGKVNTLEMAAGKKGRPGAGGLESRNVNLVPNADRVGLMGHSAMGKETAAVAASNQQQPAIIAHLNAQLQFLHDEVERLEQALTEAREEAAEEAATRNSFFEKELRAREATVEQLQQDVARLNAQLKPHRRACRLGDGEDIGQKIKELELRAATAHNDRNEAMMEKHALQQKVRALEAQLRGTKSNASELKETAEHQRSTNEQEIEKLRAMVAALNTERQVVQNKFDQLNASVKDKAANVVAGWSQTVDTEPSPKVAAVMQTEETPRPTVSESCQVNTALLTSTTEGEKSASPLRTIDTSGTTAAVNASTMSSATAHTMAMVTDPSNYNISLVRHSLEQKCVELDTVRAELEEIISKYNQATINVKELSAAHQQELNRRRDWESEIEQLKVQQRAQMQKISQDHVALRDRDAALRAAEERAQGAVAAAAKMEQERQAFEHQLAANSSDLQQLIAEQNVASEQAARAAAEADAVRDELHKSKNAEAQLQHAVKAKQMELADVLASYQHCVQEHESTVLAARSMESELDKLRVALSSRDQRIKNDCDSMEQMRHREQQLIMDLQALDHENMILRKKLTQSELKGQSTDAESNELRNSVTATQRVLQEFERAQSELHKDLVLKDNQLMYLRQRCDSSEHDFNALNAQHGVVLQKLKELEETNSRLMVRNVMSSVQTANSQQQQSSDLQEAQRNIQELTKDGSDARRALSELRRKFDEAVVALDEERQAVSSLRAAMAQKQCQWEELEEKHDRLKILLAQHMETLNKSVEEDSGEDDGEEQQHA